MYCLLWHLKNHCHAALIFLAGTQDDYAVDFDPRFCIDEKNPFTPSATETKKYWLYLKILFLGEWCHSYYTSDADQRLTMGPVGDNNNAGHAEGEWLEWLVL